MVLGQSDELEIDGRYARIINMGHPVPYARSRGPVTRDELRRWRGSHQLLADMVDTLHDYGGIGLAAPQIDGARCALAIIELPQWSDPLRRAGRGAA